MNIKLISILAVALGVSTAHAQTTVSGEFFGNLTFELDNGKADHDANPATATTDNTTGFGFTTERARVGVNHIVNDTWSVALEVDGAGGATFSKANVTAKNWLADGHTMRFGKQQNAYQRMWEANNARWIHTDLANGRVWDLYRGYINGLENSVPAPQADLVGNANTTTYTGLNYNVAFNDAWQLEISLNNGPDSDFQKTSSTAMGYGVALFGKLNDNFGLLVGYDAYDAFNNTVDDKAKDVAPGLTLLRASVFYTSDIIDAGLEYVSYAHNKEDSAAAGVTITEGEDVDAQSLHLNWKYAENRGVFAQYTMSGADKEIGLENAMTVGHTWTLEKGINTGIFYTAESHKNSDSDNSAIQWKWAASF